MKVLILEFIEEQSYVNYLSEFSLKFNIYDLKKNLKINR